MSTNLHDILNAYSIHIYWNYWDVVGSKSGSTPSTPSSAT